MKLKPVNPRSVLRRINRLIEPTGMTLRSLRGNHRLVNSLGKYFIVSLSTGAVDRTVLCLDSLAEEYGVLKGDEFLCWPEEAGKEVL